MPSQFTRNSLIMVKSRRRKKEGFNNPLISASDLNTGSMTLKLSITYIDLKEMTMGFVKTVL